jgi:nucleotide-binding universal stress UspA family protein
MPLLNTDDRLAPPRRRECIPKLSRILAPVVFSPQCEVASRYAALLASRSDSELMLLHIIEPTFPLMPAGYSGALSGEAGNSAAYARTQLAAFPSTDMPGLTIRREVVTGEPEQMIVKVAESANCDLIVMATRGLGLVRRLLMRSVSAKVLDESPCPVLLGTHLTNYGTATPKFKTILCAIDLELSSRVLLQWSSWMANRFGCDLTVVHVLPDAPAELEGDRKRIHFDERWEDALAAAAVCRFNAMQRAWGTKHSLRLQRGTVSQGLRTIAESTRADLLIIGRGDRRRSWGRLRAKADTIIRDSPCPVMAI